MNIHACRYCGTPVAWLHRSTTGLSVALDLDPVPYSTAHPDAPLYAVRRDGTAQAVRDIKAPPKEAYLSHRCPQYSDALAALVPIGDLDALAAWFDATPPVRSRRARRHLRVVS